MDATRIAGLDVTRGFAVMGILAMNIIAFAMPEPAYTSPVAYGSNGAADYATWGIAFVLFDSKMRGLFSMMFGASTLLVMQAAEASGSSPAARHYARMGVLAMFGLLHFYLIWWGDILWLYAICGLLLFTMRNFSVRALLIAGTLFTLLAMAMYLAFVMSLDADSEMITALAANSPKVLQELAIYGGSYADIIGYRVGEMGGSPIGILIFVGPETLGLMLFGMAMFKSGLLAGSWPVERLWRWALGGLGIGLIANIALLGWQISTGYDGWTLFSTTLLWSIPGDIAMSVGYAALFMWLAQRFAHHPLVARVGAAGRAAFTNYLGTSILMTSIFYGYGLGLFGEVSRTACYTFVAGTWLLMLLWSKPWLERYRYGPLEWLWRSLSRGRLEPMKR